MPTTADARKPSASGLVYPVAEKKEVVDTYHGVSVTDPYRWLEDPSAPETRKWIDEQVGLTSDYLEKECPSRTNCKDRQLEMQNYEKFGIPFKRGKRYFFYKNDGLQNHYVLYKQDNLEDEKADVLLDPNALSEDGTASVGTAKFSDSGEFLAYGINQSGSDWTTIKVRRVADSKDAEDTLSWVKFSSISWIGDDGFFYSRYPVPAKFAKEGDENFSRGEETEGLSNQSLYYHKLGTPQSEDIKAFAMPEQPKWMVSGEVTHDSKYLLVSISDSCMPVNRLYVADLSAWDRKAPFSNDSISKSIDNFDAGYDYVHNIGQTLYFKTNHEAPCYKVVKFDVKSPDPGSWTTVIPERKNVVLEDASVCDSKYLLTTHLEHVKNKIGLYDLEGKLVKNDFEMPEVACVSTSSHHEQKDIFYKFYSFLYPGTVMHYNIDTGKTRLFKETKVKGFSPEDYVATQVFYESKDKTKVPMFIVHKKSIKPATGEGKKGEHPVLLYGYGGFSISIKPSFSISRVVWMQHYDGVYAVPNIRGGGEYGEEWHEAGIKLKKQNVFDDFQYAAKHLINTGYTSPDKIAIWGGSNGGLLTAACANQAPELFGCAVAAVGVLDMLRFHKFTIGYAWCSDYGNADENKDEFEALYKISPCHNVRDNVQYPAMLITTADHDDRVSPLHSFKYTAALQDIAGPENKKPLLARIEVKAGHGAGKPLSKQIEESADVFAFVAKNVGAEWRD